MKNTTELKGNQELLGFAQETLIVGHYNQSLIDRCAYYLRWHEGLIEDNDIEYIEDYIRFWLPKE